MSLPVRICPSILSADFAALGAAVDCVRAETDWLHVDVMDGHFVPNISVGPLVVSSLRRHTDQFLDCHLMIADPAAYLPAFAAAGASSCSVHVELGGTRSLIAQTRDLGMGVGIVANPGTPFRDYAPLLGMLFHRDRFSVGLAYRGSLKSIIEFNVIALGLPIMTPEITMTAVAVV